MKFYVVIFVNGMEGYVVIRNILCFCVNCFLDGIFLFDLVCGWKKFCMKLISEEGMLRVEIIVF